MSNTKIAWADKVWNPVTGCTPSSEGCQNCYARELHNRRHKAYLMGAKLPICYAKPFNEIQLYANRLEAPLHWRKPARVFINSMSDLFHPDVPFEFIDRVMAVVARCPQHTFMVLTKRPERMEEYFTCFKPCRFASGYVTRNAEEPAAYGGNAQFIVGDDRWPLPNLWLGVSVENQQAADERIPMLLQTPSAVRFLSLEPLLGPVDMRPNDPTGPIYPYCRFCYGDEAQHDGACLRYGDGSRIDWIIVGGETGPGARPMNIDWALSLRRQCQQAGVPFFMKQLGGHPYSTIDLADTETLRRLIERRYKTTHWGQTRLITPRLVTGKLGDGRKLVHITPLSTRPNYYVLRIDSQMGTSNWDECEEKNCPAEWIDQAYELIEDEYGSSRDGWHFPEPNLENGSCWGLYKPPLNYLDVHGNQSHDMDAWPAELRVREFPEVSR